MMEGKQKPDAKKKKLDKYHIVFLLFMLLVAGWLVAWGLRGGQGVSIYPTLGTPKAAQPDTSFMIKDNTYPTVAQVRDQVQVSPACAYSIFQTTPGEYRLRPLSLLAAGQKFTITYNKQSFAFTVADIVMVQSVYPAHNAKKVDVEAGVTFAFNVDNITVDEFEAAFTIQPAVEGRFVKKDSKLIFYPVHAMQYDTLYTVVLDTKLTSQDGAVLQSGYKLSFTTETEYFGQTPPRSNVWIDQSKVAVTNLADQTPVFVFGANQGGSNAQPPEYKASVAVYSFANVEDYIAQLKANERVGRAGVSSTVDFARTQEVARFEDIEAINISEYSNAPSGQWALPLPETLPKGWYAVKIAVKDEKNNSYQLESLLQVTELSVFAMFNGNSLLAWVNNAVTGQAVQGAVVSAQPDYTKAPVTDANGVAYINQPPRTEEGTEEINEVRCILKVQAGEDVFVDSISRYSPYNSIDTYVEGRKYYGYLYADRPLYHSTDTVRLWGMVRPRNPAQTSQPQKIVLAQWGRGGQEYPVDLEKDGTFTFTVPLDSVRGNYGNFYIKVGDAALDNASVYFMIADSDAPQYTAAATLSLPVYREGVDPAPELSMQVNLFDGTPVSSLPMQINSDGLDIKAEAQTDSSGTLRATLHTTKSPDTWAPQFYYYQAVSSNPQALEYTYSGSVAVLHRDVMLEASRAKDAPESVDVRTHSIDTSGIEKTWQLWDEDKLRGKSVDTAVHVEVHKIEYVKTTSYVYYDTANRKKQEGYRYDRVDTLVEERDIVTAGGAARISGLPNLQGNAYYELVLSCMDSMGRRVETRLFTGFINNPPNTYSPTKYTLRPNAAEVRTDGYYEWMPPQKFAEGETQNFTFAVNGVPVQGMKGRLLYCTVQDDFTNIQVSTSAKVSLAYQEDLLPNYKLMGAYFDGRGVYVLDETNMVFDFSLRKLDVSIQPGKQAYSPGEKIQLDVMVKRNKTGTPAAGCKVLVSVVDEAVFAQSGYSAGGGQPYILQSLYASLYYPEVWKYTSYTADDYFSGGKGGGGGDEPPREKFEDTAYYAVLTADDTGRAVAEFTLPDNITSWRVTAVALTPDNYAGDGYTNVAATLPFFVQPVVNHVALAGDSIAVGLYSHGSAVQPQDEVQYTVRVLDNNIEAQQIKAPVRGYACVNFGSLPEGNYTVEIQGECKGYKDAVRMPMSVVKQALEVSVCKTVPLDELKNISPSRYPVDVILYAENAKMYNNMLDVLQRKLRYTDKDRADGRIAEKFVATEQKNIGYTWFNTQAYKSSLQDIDGENALLGLYPYAEQSLELSIKAHLAAPQWVSPPYLPPEGEDSQGRVPDAAPGLQFLAQALNGNTQEDYTGYLQEDAPTQDKIYYAMALVQSGRAEEAKEWYAEEISSRLQEQYALDGTRLLYVYNKSNGQVEPDATAAASMLAGMLHNPDAHALAACLGSWQQESSEYLLELVYYLQSVRPPAGEEPYMAGQAVAAYTLDGVKTQVRLGAGVRCVSLNRSQLQQADFTQVAGKVYADVVYMGSPGEMVQKQNNLVRLTKTITPVGHGFALGEMVKITIEMDFSALSTSAQWERFDLYDAIPAGLRYTSVLKEYDVENGWYMRSQQGQMLEFSVYGAEGRITRAQPIVYYAIISTPGHYVVESAYIVNVKGGVGGFSARSEINIAAK